MQLHKAVRQHKTDTHVHKLLYYAGVTELHAMQQVIADILAAPRTGTRVVL